jgi:predicted Zn-dependent peptidase
VPYGDEDQVALELIKTYLCVGISSKLYQEIRDKRGLAYNIGTESDCYSDAGLFTIHVSTKKENVKQILELCSAEMVNLKSGIEPKKLEETKNKLTGLIKIANEDMEYRNHILGASTLRLGHPRSLKEELKNINTTTNEKIATTAEKTFNNLSFITIGLHKKEHQNLQQTIN